MKRELPSCTQQQRGEQLPAMLWSGALPDAQAMCDQVRCRPLWLSKGQQGMAAAGSRYAEKLQAQQTLQSDVHGMAGQMHEMAGQVHDMAGQVSRVATRVWFRKVSDSMGLLQRQTLPSKPYTARWQSKVLPLSLTSCKPAG